jgi:isopenicillin N synthase-like dioxygenase
MENVALKQADGTLPPTSPGLAETIAAGRTLPLLNLGPYLAGEAGALEQLAADVRAVQEGLGFYAVVNHGVDQALIEEAVEQTRTLFRLPEDVRLAQRGGFNLQGYWPPASTGNPDGEFADEKEKVGSLAGWAILREREADDPKVVADLRHRVLNKWPDAALVPGFRPALLRYQAAILDLGLKLLPVYARALGLAADYFEGSFTQPEWYLRCNYYSGGRAREGGIATVAHIDHSFMTLLPMSTIPGLEVRTHNKQWMEVSYVEHSIIVNTGEWLSQLSNGRFLATPHRVTEPVSERITLPLFLDPDDEMVNDPVPGTASGKAPGFPRRTFHEHFVKYLSSHYKTEEASAAAK